MKAVGELLRKAGYVGVVHIHLILQAAITVPGGGSRGYPYSARLTYTRITYHS